MKGVTWRLIDKAGPLPEARPELGSCWLWKGGLTSGGYGKHRHVYEILRGPVAKGEQLDHLCRVRSCVNPDHLEPVSCRENLFRGETINARRAAQTHCIHGHPFDEANTYIDGNGTRSCRQCMVDRDRKRRSIRRH